MTAISIVLGVSTLNVLLTCFRAWDYMHSEQAAEILAKYPTIPGTVARASFYFTFSAWLALHVYALVFFLRYVWS